MEINKRKVTEIMTTYELTSQDVEQALLNFLKIEDSNDDITFNLNDRTDTATVFVKKIINE